MRRRLKVLVFPCGSENASEIHQALRYSVHVDLIGASSVDDFGRFRFERYVGGLPNIKDPAFDEAFRGVLTKFGVELIFATHDSVQEYLARSASAIGAHLVNGDPRTSEVVRRKSKTYALFVDCPWVPLVFGSIDEIREWPVVVKPDAGQGGQGVTVSNDRDEAARAMTDMTDPLLVEYLPGDEITVDCFSDRERQLIWVGPRTRERVRAGITMRSTFLDLTPEVQEIASEINRRLTLRGPWFFQLKQDRSRRWKLLEVSSRVAGAMAAHRARGVNLPLMAIHDYLGRRLTSLPVGQVALIERNIATRAELKFEYDTVFIDLDDALIMDDGFANPMIIAFLYQARRDGKQIKLITRHARDVKETLARARVAIELFDDIVIVQAERSKAEYVTANAIFIDNLFPERLEVATQRNIPVFDVDAIEFLVR
jgi:hypothetical protein